MNRITGSTWGIWVAGLLATVAATILNIIFLYLSQTVFEIVPRVTTTFGSVELGELGLLQTALVTIIPGIVGTVIYWLLVRFTPYPNVLFGALAFLVFALSLGGPFALAITGPEKLVLSILHLIPAVVITKSLLVAGWAACCCDEEWCEDEHCKECIVICDDCGEEDCAECSVVV